MKLWVISDLHIDSHRFTLPATPQDTDALVIAGDVRELTEVALAQVIDWQHQAGIPLVWVPGNHDYYGSDLNVFEDMLLDFGSRGVHILHCGQTVEINGTRIVGATLWTDFDIYGSSFANQKYAMQSMPDYNAIDVGRRRLRTRDLVEAHEVQRAAIEAVLATSFDGPTVVVTHHAPHPRSLVGGAPSHESDGSFASDLSELMLHYGPELWIHGHVHQSHDYVVGETRVLCNPRGYGLSHEGVSLTNKAFDPDMVVEVADWGWKPKPPF